MIVTVFLSCMYDYSKKDTVAEMEYCQIWLSKNKLATYRRVFFMLFGLMLFL